MGRLKTITRRSFMGLGIAAAGGLAVGFYTYRKPYANPLLASAAEGEAVFNPYVKISVDNVITIIAPRAEMGQGVHTTLAALVAEELDVTLEQVVVEHGPSGKAYYNEAGVVDGGAYPFFEESFKVDATRATMKIAAKFLGLQMTGGSSATIDAFVKMREAGCAARMVLVSAAAAHWGVPVDGLLTKNGVITNPATGETLTYGEISEDAAALKPPRDLELRPRESWKILGKSQSRVEIMDKVTGGPIFGIDVQLPDMLYGTVLISPRFGVGAKSVDKSAALAVAGVRDVVDVETSTGSGFGIIADNTWAAFQGAEALEVVWNDAPYPADHTAIDVQLSKALKRDASFSLGKVGDVNETFENTGSAQMISAEYNAPYLAHSTMEPINATAQFKDGKLAIWLGTQAPGLAAYRCASLLDISTKNVTVNTTRMGGGFGRRFEVDAPLYATALAAKTGGRPIKVTWTREEDTRHDTYRPIAKAMFKASVSDTGEVTGIAANIATPTIIGSLIRRTFPAIPAPAGVEKTMLEGAFDQPMSIPNRNYSAHTTDLAIPVGFWRSVGNSYNGFFQESFLDEIAHETGQDPLAFRLSIMNDAEHHPAREALKKVAEMAGWGREMPAGKGLGIAHVISFGTWVAQVIQVDVSGGDVKIEKVWCVADAGLVLDPTIFKDQMMSGIIYGLSAAMGQEITFKDGEVQQGNFDDYDAMRMYQCPEIMVELLENSRRMGGAGEPGTPPAAPALANAIFAATGQRIRSMPFSGTIDFA